jgi:glucose-6-phosphate isomerase
MKSTMPPLRTQRPEWTALSGHHQEIQHLHLRDLFAEDPRHGERLTAEAAGLYLDYSKHRITDRLSTSLYRWAAFRRGVDWKMR